MTEAHHGNTVAAWTAVIIILVAFLIGGVGVLLQNWPVFWGAVILALVGGIAGKVLQMMGYGQVASGRQGS